MCYEDILSLTDKSEMCAFTVVTLVIIFTGILGNGLLITVYVRFRGKDKRLYDKFIKLLSGIDLLVCGVIAPYIMLYEFQRVNNDVMCRLMEFLRTFLVCASNVSLCAVAYDRYCAVCKPFELLSVRHLYISVVTVLTVSLVTSAPTPFLYAVAQHTHNVAGNTSANDVAQHTHGVAGNISTRDEYCHSTTDFVGEFWILAYNVYLVLLYLVGLCSISCMYTRIFIELKRKSVKKPPPAVRFVSEPNLIGKTNNVNIMSSISQSMTEINCKAQVLFDEKRNSPSHSLNLESLSDVSAVQSVLQDNRSVLQDNRSKVHDNRSVLHDQRSDVFSKCSTPQCENHPSGCSFQFENSSQCDKTTAYYAESKPQLDNTLDTSTKNIKLEENFDQSTLYARRFGSINQNKGKYIPKFDKGISKTEKDIPKSYNDIQKSDKAMLKRTRSVHNIGKLVTKNVLGKVPHIDLNRRRSVDYFNVNVEVLNSVPMAGKIRRDSVQSILENRNNIILPALCFDSQSSKKRKVCGNKERRVSRSKRKESSSSQVRKYSYSHNSSINVTEIHRKSPVNVTARQRKSTTHEMPSNSISENEKMTNSLNSVNVNVGNQLLHYLATSSSRFNIEHKCQHSPYIVKRDRSPQSANFANDEKRNNLLSNPITSPNLDIENGDWSTPSMSHNTFNTHNNLSPVQIANNRSLTQTSSELDLSHHKRTLFPNCIDASQNDIHLQTHSTVPDVHCSFKHVSTSPNNSLLSAGDRRMTGSPKSLNSATEDRNRSYTQISPRTSPNSIDQQMALQLPSLGHRDQRWSTSEISPKRLPKGTINLGISPKHPIEVTERTYSVSIKSQSLDYYLEKDPSILHTENVSKTPKPKQNERKEWNRRETSLLEVKPKKCLTVPHNWHKGSHRKANVSKRLSTKYDFRKLSRRTATVHNQQNAHSLKKRRSMNAFKVRKSSAHEIRILRHRTSTISSMFNRISTGSTRWPSSQECNVPVYPPMTPRHIRTGATLFLCIVVHILTWLPSCLDLFQLTNSLLLRYCFLMGHTINPIIYGIINKRVRSDIFELVKGRMQQSVPEKSNANTE